MTPEVPPQESQRRAVKTMSPVRKLESSFELGISRAPFLADANARNVGLRMNCALRQNLESVLRNLVGRPVIKALRACHSNWSAEFICKLASVRPTIFEERVYVPPLKACLIG